MIFFDFILNFIFIWDIVVMVNDYVIIIKVVKEVCFCENFLIWYIFWVYFIFNVLSKEGCIINLNNVELFLFFCCWEMVSIEGGDVMVINEDYLFIGCSECMIVYVIQLFKEVFFKKGVVKYVVQINILIDCSYMYIDIIFM